MKASWSSYFKNNGEPIKDFKQGVKMIIFAFQKLCSGCAVKNRLKVCQSGCLESNEGINEVSTSDNVSLNLSGGETRLNIDSRNVLKAKLTF